MATIVTVKDVAQRAEVSVGTVSRVFNDHSNVTDKIRQRVLKAAAELGYVGSAGRVSRAATNASSLGFEVFANGSGKAMKEIGFLFCYPMNVEQSEVTANPIWSRVLKGAANAASHWSNIKVTFWAIDHLLSTPERLFASLIERHLDGVILVGTVEPEIIRLIQNSKIPLVLIDSCMPGLSVDAVLGDNFGGAQQAVEYLISENHRRIAFLSGPTRQGVRPVNVFYSIERRAAGYRTALLDAGIPVDYDLFEADSVTVEGGYQACKRLVERGAQFSALFCANDFMAIGAMKALREAGLRIPEDVSLVGFDDVDMVEHLSPALTTVRSPKEAVGYAAVRNLLFRSNDPEAFATTIMLETELVKRASVIPCLSH